MGGGGGGGGSDICFSRSQEFTLNLKIKLIMCFAFGLPPVHNQLHVYYVLGMSF